MTILQPSHPVPCFLILRHRMKVLAKIKWAKIWKLFVVNVAYGDTVQSRNCGNFRLQKIVLNAVVSSFCGRGQITGSRSVGHGLTAPCLSTSAAAAAVTDGMVDNTVIPKHRTRRLAAQH